MQAYRTGKRADLLLLGREGLLLFEGEVAHRPRHRKRSVDPLVLDEPVGLFDARLLRLQLGYMRSGFRVQGSEARLVNRRTSRGVDFEFGASRLLVQG